MIERGCDVNETKFEKPLKVDHSVKYVIMPQIEIKSESKFVAKFNILGWSDSVVLRNIEGQITDNKMDVVYVTLSVGPNCVQFSTVSDGTVQGIKCGV